MEKMEDCEESSVNRDDTARPWQSYNTVYTNAKAGMEGVDKEKVQRIVYEMSKGSKYFENEERKEASMRQKIENMRAHCAKLTASDISHHQMMAEERIVELEATRDLSRIWLHVDMDAFYAAVETLSNPSLQGKPMAVGSLSMISTANYEARRFGVRAAMPGFIARKLCPELIFVPTDFKKYTHYSDLTRKVYHKYDPNFVAASLDEAYLDITNACKERGLSSEEIAEELRRSVNEETGLTCSAGVAPNRLLAKVCSDINKPNGQFHLPNDRMGVMTFISSVPIRKIGGIGKVTENILSDVLGVKTCEDLLRKSGLLYALFSRSSADFFLCVGLGIGKTETPEVSMRKSISNERTFSATGDEAFLYSKLVELAEMLSIDMTKEGISGRTLTLKLKTSSFEVKNRAITLQKYICSSEDILTHASKLLKAELPISLRLIGLRMSQFNEDKNGVRSDPTQKTLTNFFVPGDTYEKKNFFVPGDTYERSTETSGSLGEDVDDHHFTNEKETYLPTDNHNSIPNNFKQLSDNIHSLDHENNGCSSSNSACETEGSHQPITNKTAQKCDENSPERATKRTKHSDDEAVCSSFFWVNDYKCSICGIEMPPSFVEERQEHSDFHLAERLQKEESCTISTNLSTTQRSQQNDGNSNQSKRKKQKPSPRKGKHIPIDAFFVKE